MGVSLGHSRDLMTIAQVSYNVTASVQPRLKLCWFSHFTGWVRPLTITLLLFNSRHNGRDRTVKVGHEIGLKTLLIIELTETALSRISSLQTRTEQAVSLLTVVEASCHSQ